MLRFESGAAFSEEDDLFDEDSSSISLRESKKQRLKKTKKSKKKRKDKVSNSAERPLSSHREQSVESQLSDLSVNTSSSKKPHLQIRRVSFNDKDVEVHFVERIDEDEEVE